MIQAALKVPYVIIVVALAVVVIGVTSHQKIPADLLPIFNTPAVQIVTFYHRMPPKVMERDIMSRLEQWTGQSIGIEHQEAKAMLGMSIVKDFFREDISMETAMAQVTSYAILPLDRRCGNGTLALRSRQHGLVLDGFGGPTYKTLDCNRLQYMSDMFYLPPGTIPPMVMPFDPTASAPLCLVIVSCAEMNEKG